MDNTSRVTSADNTKEGKTAIQQKNKTLVYESFEQPLSLADSESQPDAVIKKELRACRMA